MLLIGVLTLGGLQSAHAQFATWSRPLAPGIVNAQSVTDATGNTYVAGSYQGSVTMGSTTLPVPASNQAGGPGSNAFLAKINPQGLVQWVLPGVSNKLDDVAALTLDPSGNVYTVFYAGIDSMRTNPGPSASFTLGGQTLNPGGIALARVSPAGVVTSLSHLHQGNSRAQVTALAADAAGNAYVGVYGGQGQAFGPHTFPATYSSIILRYAASGGVTVMQNLVPSPTVTNGYASLSIQALHLGPGGDLFCAGSLYGSATLGTSPAITLTSPSNGNGGFLVRYSPAGIAQWGVINTSSSGSNNVMACNISVNASGEVYLAGGSTTADAAFGGLPLGQAGGYVLKVSASGTPLWVRAAQTSSYDDGSRRTSRLALDAAGNVYRMGVFRESAVAFGSQVLNHPLFSSQLQIYPPAFYLVSYDAAGTERWVRAVDGQVPPGSGNPSSIFHSGAGLGSDASGNLYVLMLLQSFGTAGSQLHINGQVLSNGYTALRLEAAGRVSGLVYLDMNANGQRDAMEPPFPFSQIIADQNQTSIFASSSPQGQYSAFAPAGTPFSLTIASPPPSYTLSAPAVRSGTFPAAGQSVNGMDFGLVPLSNQTDVRVTLTPFSPARPGFTTQYQLTLENVGTTLASGTVNLAHDSRLTYTSSVPQGSVAGQNVSWTYANLPPFARLSYVVSFSLPATVALGTQLTSTGTAPLAGDVNPANNTEVLTQGVIGSYDPNDISVNYSRLTPAQVAAAQPLDYTIRFQNMGTDQAFNVVITDELDFTRLNLSTLDLLAQSHSCTWSLSNRGLLTVRFPNIQLPHQAADALRSQGFVRFRVRPRTSLVVGDIVPNEADIFFDYNAPVRTNTATTAVFNPTALLSGQQAAAWAAYPNPAADVLTVAATLTQAGTVGLDLTDALGRTIRQHRLTAAAGALHHSLDLRGVAPGLYLLRLTLPNGQHSSQRVQVN
ncbi:hypothetical protein GCM10023185_09510 [Hymenobacter saemangeumensis]|uniref:T9SS type A sorting domain-containing protein n=1 Tax=Hymenobacter saemangeumensis TaxID=1084522 RepID=A0ABP8I4C2_9BACT